MSRRPIAPAAGRPALVFAAAAIAAAAAGCGPRAEPVSVGEGFSDREAPAPADAPPPPRARAATLERAVLDEVLAGGPGRFLATFEVRARLVDGKFTGWEMVRAPWAAIDLVPTDVVVQVNRRTLERPLELESLWAELRTADDVVIEVDRQGERFTLELSIAGAPTSAPAPDPAAGKGKGKGKGAASPPRRRR